VISHYINLYIYIYIMRNHIGRWLLTFIGKLKKPSFWNKYSERLFIIDVKKIYEGI